MSRKEYINSSNESPKISGGTIVFWYMAIQYFNWPDWTLGVWGLLSIITIGVFIYRIATEDGVDVVRRKQ